MNYFFCVCMVFFQLILSFPIFAEGEWVTVESAVRKVTITGFTRAQSKMPLATEVEGKVGKVFADVGEIIPDTSKFACLDDTFAKIDIKSAKNEMSRHYTDINYFKKEVARHKKLVKKQTSAVSVLDGLIRNLDNARQDLSVASIRKQRFKEHQRRHCIEAPKGWMVIDRNVEPGQWVSQGQVIGHIGDYSQLNVPIRLTQVELTALRKEQDLLELLLVDYQLTVPATIDHISPAFDEKTRKILVDLLIKKEIPESHGGMRVRLTLNIPDSKSTSFIITEQALDERFEEYWINRKDGKRIRVKLMKELADGMVLISSQEIKLGDQFKLN